MTREELTQLSLSLLRYKSKAARLSFFCDVLGGEPEGQTKKAMLDELTECLVSHLVIIRPHNLKFREENNSYIDKPCGYDNDNQRMVTLQLDAKGYWNLSSMCRSHLTSGSANKLFADWYSHEKTKLYLNLIADHLSQPLESLIDSEDLRRREPKEDIFGHPYIAMRLAEYIKPQLESWLYIDHILDSSDGELLCLKSYVEKASLLEDKLKGEYRAEEYDSTL